MNYKIYALLGALILLGSGIVYSLEFNWFNRTINMPELARYALLIGGLAGAAIAWAQRHQGRDQLERVQLFIFFIVIIGLYGPLFASLSNRLLSFRPEEYKTVKVTEENAFYASRTPPIKGETVKPSGYYLFFYFQNELRRIKIEKSYLRGRDPGTEIQLPMKKGLWGYYVVLQPDPADGH
jgi:hypothetical protein